MAHRKSNKYTERAMSVQKMKRHHSWWTNLIHIRLLLLILYNLYLTMMLNFKKIVRYKRSSTRKGGITAGAHQGWNNMMTRNGTLRSRWRTTGGSLIHILEIMVLKISLMTQSVRILAYESFKAETKMTEKDTLLPKTPMNYSQ